jgi:NADPH:quinone reductase-like Zn-dependent oxidoreductase
MKALRFHEYGAVNVLRYEEAPTPRPGPGEVLVAVAATACNPVDRWFRAGAMDEILLVRFPHTLGLDVAGTVVDHGPGVEDPAIGAEAIIVVVGVAAAVVTHRYHFTHRRWRRAGQIGAALVLCVGCWTLILGIVDLTDNIE